MLPSASSSLLSYTLPQWIQMHATLHFPSIQPSGVLPSPVPIHHGPTILLDEAFILLLDLELFLLGELFPCLGALLKVAVHGREVTLLEVMNHLGLCWSHDLEGGAGVGTTTQSRGRGRGGHYNSAKGEGQGRALQLSQGGGARAGTTTQPRGPLYRCSLLSPTPASVPIHSTEPTFLQSCQKFFTKISLEVYSWSSILAKNPATCKGARQRRASYTCRTGQTTASFTPVITFRQLTYAPHTCTHRHRRTPAHPSPLQQPALVAWADRYSRT